MQQVAYPVSFSVAYPERPLDRLTTAFRWIIAIPIMVVLASVSGGSFRFGEAAQIVIAAGGAVFLGPMLMILFRAYPSSWSPATTRPSAWRRSQTSAPPRGLRAADSVPEPVHRPAPIPATESAATGGPLTTAMT